MSFDPAVNRRQRGAGKALLSRMLNIVESLLREHPKTLKPVALESYIENVAKAHKQFEDNHAVLAANDSSQTEEQHSAEAELHEVSMEKFAEAVNDLKDIAQAWLKGRRLVIALEALEEQLEGTYLPDKASQYVAIEAALEVFRDAFTPDVVSEYAELQLLDKDIKSKWNKVIKIRAETGFTFESPRGGDVGHSRGAEGGSSYGRPHGSNLKIPPPKFSGVLSDFSDYRALFMAVVDGEPIPEAGKKSLLIASMEQPTDIANAIAACKESDTLKKAMRVFSARYEDKKEVVSYHLGKILNVEMTGQTKDELENLDRVTRNGISGLKLADSFTAEQITIACVVNRMKPQLKKEWLQKMAEREDPPDMVAFNSFMKAQIRVVSGLSTMEKVVEMDKESPSYAATAGVSLPPPKRFNPRSRSRQQESTPPKSKNVFRATSEKKCGYCQGQHLIYACRDFKQKSKTEKKAIVREKRLCYNCLCEGHRVSDCPSEKTCSVCQQHHHSLLHESKEPSESANINRVISVSGQGLASTAAVVVDAGGCEVPARLLVDTGAEVSVVSEALARHLKAERIPKSAMKLCGMGQTMSEYAVRVVLHGDARVGRGEDTLVLKAQVVQSIPQPSGNRSVAEFRSLSCLTDLPLADPSYQQGSKIDLLLSCAGWCQARMVGSRGDPSKGVFADKSMFGWVVAGQKVEARQAPRRDRLRVYAVKPSEQRLEDLIEQQWLTEKIPGEESTLSKDSVQADEHFYSTHRREDDGRHAVGVPPAENGQVLGESRKQAVNRYYSVKKSLLRKGRWQAYHAAVQNFLDEDHAELVPSKDLGKPVTDTYYMPMHAIMKESSSTTKVRPVCDASADTSSGSSYNDVILVGPSLYQPLPSILNRFRDAAVAMTADVSKMYRQIALRDEDRDYHRFVFAEEGDVLRDYRMKRLTFGVKSSPYLACKVLQEIGRASEESHPVAAHTIQTQFYMDDVLTGADTVEEASRKRQDLNLVLEENKLPLCKWRTNSRALLETIPQQLRESSDLMIGARPVECQKALGIHWSTEADALYIATPKFQDEGSVTKRMLASVTARIYDPMGWFAPAIMKTRMWTQDAWKLPSSWDSVLPAKIYNPFKEWVSQMPMLTSHPIPRALGKAEGVVHHRELHGYSDASEHGFGGVVFLRTVLESGRVVIDNVMAKGRVAPIEELTIPKLELKGALVLAQLLHATAKDLKIEKESVYAWTDSTIVLGWLNHSPSRLTVFVGNRIAQIQALTKTSQWGHVPGTQNPADCLSRGVTPKELLHIKMWWKGPEWLAKAKAYWPKYPNVEVDVLPELRRNVGAVVLTPEEMGERQASVKGWTRVMAWCLRFINNCHTGRERRSRCILTATELTEAKDRVLLVSQRFHYSQEYECLVKGKTLDKRHFLRKLTPFVDKAGLIRIGGRLCHADLPESAIHPILLSSKSAITRMIMEEVHCKMRHASTSAMLASVAYTYHIPRVQPMLRSIRNRCLECQKLFGKPVQQAMGDLPAVRTNPSDVFAEVGVDYAGPVYIKSGRGKNFRRIPTYLALFVCMATRAIHIEVAADTSTAAFLAVLDRFCARRGVPTTVYSDNGTNFVGAQSELRQLTADLRTDQAQRDLVEWTTSREIRWNFQPARAPNFGGLWEAGVRQMKRLLGKVLKSPNLSLDELTTVVVSCEAILNSRPYLPLYSTSDEEMLPLTPGHFLVHRPLCALPQREASISRLTKARRWHLVKNLEFELWDRWRREYLRQLMSRGKQWKQHPNLRVGDVVLVMEDGTKRNQWPLARVSKVYPGPDDLVRVVDVTLSKPSSDSSTVSQRTWRRTVRKLIRMPLHVESEEDATESDTLCGGGCSGSSSEPEDLDIN